MTSWKGILRKIANSLSKSNDFLQDMDVYFPAGEVPNEGKGEQEGEGEEDDDEAYDEAEIRALRCLFIAYDPEENVADKSLVPGIKELARLLVQVEDHI